MVSHSLPIPIGYGLSALSAVGLNFNRSVLNQERGVNENWEGNLIVWERWRFMVCLGKRPISALTISFSNRPAVTSWRAVSQNDSRMCLCKEPLHRYPSGLLENFCTSPGGIYYKYGKVAIATTSGKQKRKSNIEHIDSIPLFAMSVVSLRIPFWSKQDKIVWTCRPNGSWNELP